MKTKKQFSLLFYIVTFSFFTYNSFSQVNLDSLNYYIHQINQGKLGTNELARAYILFDQEQIRSQKSKEWRRAIYYLDYMSLIENELGLYYDSERTIVKGLELLDKYDQKNRWADYRYRLLNRQGLIYWKYPLYNKSLESFSELLNYVKEDKSIGIIYNNIGATYKYLKRYDTAQFYLEKAYKINQRVKNKAEEARSLDNLGFVKGMQGAKEGVIDMMEALKIRDSLGRNLYTSYWHLTRYYKEKGSMIDASNFAYKAYNLANQDKSDSYRLEALRNLLELGLNKYIADYLELSDKIFREKQLNENKFVKIKYDYEALELERKKSELEKVKAEVQTRIYQGIAAFILLLLISITLILRTRHRKNMLIKQFETEQRISKKLHDEVANDVFHNLTKMRRDPTVSKEVLVALDQVYDKVRDISKTHADLDVNTDFGRLLNDLILSYKTQDVNIFTKNISKIVWEEVSETKRKVLYRVVQELMVNMKKHSQASLVTIKFVKERGKLHVEYIDNGVGAALEKGSGLRNTESRMELVGGKISFTSELDKGFQANLIL